MKRICVYGKGGIGKSTAVSNLAAAMAQAGKRVAVVGCDPKADTTRVLVHGRMETILDAHARTGGVGLTLADVAREGAFGVLTHVTLKVFRHMPETVKRFSYMFRDWETAQAAAREIMQSEAGFPSVFRLSDPEETEIMMRMYGVDESPLRHLFDMRGFKTGEMCLYLGFTNGEKGFSKNCARNVARVCRKFGGMSLTGFVTKI